jgi:hypothetical protein
MEAVRTSEVFVYLNKTTWPYIPESCHLHACHRENQKSHDFTLFYSNFALDCYVALCSEFLPQKFVTIETNLFVSAINENYWTRGLQPFRVHTNSETRRPLYVSADVI